MKILRFAFHSPSSANPTPPPGRPSAFAGAITRTQMSRLGNVVSSMNERTFIDVARQATEMGHALTSAPCECGGVGPPCASCAARRVAENSPERELCDKEGEGGREMGGTVGSGV